MTTEANSAVQGADVAGNAGTAGSITELAGADIQRAGGVSANSGDQQQQQRSGFAPAQDAQPEPMSQYHQVGWFHVNELREEARAKNLQGADLDRQLDKIRALSRHLAEGTARPEWYSDGPTDAKYFDNRPATVESEFERRIAEQSQPMDAAALKSLAHHGTVQGLPPDTVEIATGFIENLGLDAFAGKVIMDRVATHYRAGYDMGRPLDDGLRDQLIYDGLQAYGGNAEKMAHDAQMARALLDHVGILAEFDKLLGDTAIAFDPRAIQQLAFAAKLRGLKPTTK